MQNAHIKTWRLVNFASMTLCGTMIGLKLSPFHAALFLGLPLVRTLFKFPVLTDGPALFLFVAGWYFQNPWLMCLGTVFNEKVAVFGAVATWSLIPLLGLVVPGFLLLKGSKPSTPEWLSNPFKSAWTIRGRLLDPQCTMLPWGAVLTAVPFIDFKGVVSLVLGYAQLLMAQDSARLYQWAVLGVLPFIPAEFAPMLSIVHWANPWAEVV